MSSFHRDTASCCPAVLLRRKSLSMPPSRCSSCSSFTGSFRIAGWRQHENSAWASSLTKNNSNDKIRFGEECMRTRRIATIPCGHGSGSCVYVYTVFGVLCKSGIGRPTYHIKSYFVVLCGRLDADDGDLRIRQNDDSSKPCKQAMILTFLAQGVPSIRVSGVPMLCIICPGMEANTTCERTKTLLYSTSTQH